MLMVYFYTVPQNNKAARRSSNPAALTWISITNARAVPAHRAHGGTLLMRSRDAAAVLLLCLNDEGPALEITVPRQPAPRSRGCAISGRGIA